MYFPFYSNSLFLANKRIWNETYVDVLKRDLLMSYDKFARPTQHFNQTTVTLNLEIKHVDFDETTSIFTVYAWLSMVMVSLFLPLNLHRFQKRMNHFISQEWKDEKLKWNQTNYGNLTKSVSVSGCFLFDWKWVVKQVYWNRRIKAHSFFVWYWNVVFFSFASAHFQFEKKLSLQNGNTFFSIKFLTHTLFRIGLAQHEIWQPDISLYNSINHNLDYFGATNFLVEQNGAVLWVPPATFKTFCDLDLRNWPFDSHKCTLIFGSWIYNGEEINLQAKETHQHFDLFVENPEWEISSFTWARTVSHYVCCPDPYVDIRYNITIVRRSTIYRTVILAPAFVIILLTLLTFWLPAQYGEKIMLNGITVLLIVLFLLYFSQKLNVMGLHTPLIGIEISVFTVDKVQAFD